MLCSIRWLLPSSSFFGSNPTPPLRSSRGLVTTWCLNQCWCCYGDLLKNVVFFMFKFTICLETENKWKRHACWCYLRQIFFLMCVECFKNKPFVQPVEAEPAALPLCLWQGQADGAGRCVWPVGLPREHGGAAPGPRPHAHGSPG